MRHRRSRTSRKPRIGCLSASFHQGNVYSASIPIVWLLSELLAAAPDHPAGAAILEALRVIAEATYWADDDLDSDREPTHRSRASEPLYEAWVSQPTAQNGLDDDEYFTAATVRKELAVKLLSHAEPVVKESLSNRDARVRFAAVGAAVSCYAALPDLRPRLQQLRRLIGDKNHDPGSWLSIAMTIPSEDDEPDWLAHDDRRLRLVGALDPTRASDDRSIAQLAESLSDAEWVRSTYRSGLAHLDMHARFHLLEALLERTTAESASEAALDAIRDVLRNTTKPVVGQEWGPILRWAFPERSLEPPFPDNADPLPATLSHVQRVVLSTLVGNKALWDHRFGTARLWFKRVQLPYERKAIRRLLRATRPR